ncbi:hypothetical protein OsccyDRAFT_1740 [Leptolyngbyaceae cyanobacterium JSC-12]|nr:hypothetical protein OsccyDRAFT_1740 [Leptolyngbyaceae cyanobacterium JSC-12]
MSAAKSPKPGDLRSGDYRIQRCFTCQPSHRQKLPQHAIEEAFKLLNAQVS